MELFEYIAPCHFGLEAVLKREINDLGYDVVRVEDGKVTFTGDAQACAYANVYLRTAERILLKAGEFKAVTFEELFEKTKQIPWETWIPENGKFWVTKANSIRSKLFSTSDIQSVMKKAMVERMKQHYQKDWFEGDGAPFPVRVSAVKDVFTVGIDTTGISLHKRGYRKATVKAPITETLAAALILLTPWKKDRILVDPFCGSGTFAIEAAMMAAGMAPGGRRSFLAEQWDGLIETRHWKDAKEEAADNVDLQTETDIQGYDIDGSVIAQARENAANAGVNKLIHLQKRDVRDLSHSGKYGFLITNPPYGERIGAGEDLAALYRALGDRYRSLDSWSMYVITAMENAEEYLGGKADKNRKIYNGMMKTYLYQYLGPKPPKRNRKETGEDI